MKKFKTLALFALVAILAIAVMACDGCGGLSKEAKAFIDAVDALPEASAITVEHDGAVTTANNLYLQVSEKDRDNAKVKTAAQKLDAVKTALQAEKDRIANEEATAASEAFKTAHAAALAKTVAGETAVAIADKGIVDAALTAFEALSAGAKAKLADQKALLESLKTQIGVLEAAVADTEATAAANAFKAAHEAILAKTPTGDNAVEVSDEALVDAALTAYAALTPAAQAKAAAEKTLLDSLKNKITELKGGSTEKTAQQLADEFKETYDAVINLDQFDITQQNFATYKVNIYAAYNAYNALRTDVKEKIPDVLTKLEGLKTVVDTYEKGETGNAWVTEFTAIISKSVNDVSAADSAAIEEALEAYDALEAEGKDVAAAGYNKLISFKNRIAALAAAQTFTATVNGFGGNVTLANETAVNDALAAWTTLTGMPGWATGEGVQEALSLAVEAKGKLDNYKAKITFLKTWGDVLALNPEALNLEADEKNVNDVHTAFYALHADVRNLMATVEKVAVDTLKSAMDDLASDRDSGIFLDEFEDVLKLTVEPGENGVAIGNGNRIGLAKAAYFDGLSNPAKLLVIAVYPDVETLFDALLSRIEVLKDIASCEEFLKDYGYLFLRNAGSVDGDDQEDIEYAIAAYQILREGAQELVSAQAEEEGIEDVETFFNALLTAAAFKAAHTLLLSDLFDQYDGYNASDYFEDREEERNIWQDLVTIYDNAVIAINALTTLEAVDNYRRDVYQSVLNDMQGVKSKAWYNGAFIEIAEAEINALAASDPYRWENNYSKNDGGADRWAELQALFTNALESLSGKDTQGEIDDVVAGVRTAAADVPTLPALSADLNVQFSFSSTSFLPGTSGTTGVNPRNTAGFFGNLGDAVDFMLVKFYGEELDAETLTYGSSKVFAEYKFTWETTTSTATPPVTTGYLYAQKWENGAAVGNRVQVLSQTASIYIASATFMRTVLGDDFCTQNILTGAGVIVGKIKNIQLTATLITPVASAYGNSAEGPKKSNTSGSGAPAFGGTHPEIVAASSDFDKLVEDIGTLAYTQTKLDLLTAAEDALDGFRAAQLKFVNLLTLEALLQAREDFDGLEDAAVEAFISLVPSQSTIDTMSPSSSGEDIEAFVDAVGEALGRYGLLLESTLLEHERASEIPAAYARLLAAQTKAGTLGSAADLAASELKGLILAANLQTGPARPNTVEYARKIAPLAADLAALKNVEGAAPAIGKIATEVALLEDNIDWFTHQGSYAASGGYVKAPINLPNTNATWGGGNNVNWNISAGNDRMIVDGLYTADFRDNVEKINSILLIRMWFYDVDQNPVLVNGQQAYIDFDFYGYRTTGGTVGGQRVGWSDNNATGTAAWRVWATDINYAFGQKYPGVTLRGYNVTTAPNEGWHFRLQFVAKEYCAIGEIDYYYYANSGMDAMSAKQTKTVP